MLNLFSFLLVRESMHSQNSNMFRAIGIVIVLWYVSQLFTQSFVAADRAAKATFEALEAAAVASRQSFE